MSQYRCDGCDYKNLKDGQEIEVVMSSAVPMDINSHETGTINMTRHNGGICPYINNKKRYEPICQMPCIVAIR
jgi:hypothetical protein